MKQQIAPHFNETTGSDCVRESAISTSRLTRRFGEVCAVDELSLEVPRGSIYAFLGPNGAGKTTTIRLLLGLMYPDSGQVRIFGDLMKRANRRAILRRIGSIVETPSLYPHLTGYENLCVTRTLLSLDRSNVRRVLAIVHMEKDAHRLVKTYSQGMRQRLGIALALLANPDLLILDEPTNELDPDAMIEMRELIRAMPQEHGVTIFLSSHLLGEVEQVASHVGIIGRGRLLFEGTLNDLKARRGDRIVLETDRPGLAANVLARVGWDSESVGDSFLSVALPDRDSIPRATAALVSAGVRLYQIRSERPSLEELFLEFTRNTGLATPAKKKVVHV